VIGTLINKELNLFLAIPYFTSIQSKVPITFKTLTWSIKQPDAFCILYLTKREWTQFLHMIRQIFLEFFGDFVKHNLLW